MRYFLLSLILGIAVFLYSRETMSGKVVIGYYPNWAIYDRKYTVNDIPAEYLTHILYSFADIKDSGEVVLSDAWADEQINGDGNADNLYGNLGGLLELKKTHRHLKTLLSVGGASYSPHFAGPASRPDGRQTFVQSCLNLLENYGFDGIDVDWEFPENDNQANDYVSLLRELRQGLDQHAQSKGENNPYLLSVASPCGPWQYEKMRLREMDAYLSFWNLMAYDYCGGWESCIKHQANLFNGETSTHNAIQYYTQQGIPVNKLVLGLPLYGRSFAGTNGNIGDKFKGVGKGSFEDGVYDYKQIPLENASVDTQSVAATVYDPNTKEWTSFDNIQTIHMKGDFIIQNNLGGGMVWELSGDRPKGDPNAIVPHIGYQLAPLDSTENHLSYPRSKFGNVRG